MRFKETTKKILCIRTTYNPDKGRGEDKTVASIWRFAESVTDEVREQLTADELVQLENYLKSKNDNMAFYKQQFALQSRIVEEIKDGLKGLENPEIRGSVTPDQAAEIWAGLDAMRRAMRRAGFDRPAKTED